MHRDVGFLRQQVDLVVDEDHSVQECLQLSMTGGQWAQSEWILRDCFMLMKWRLGMCSYPRFMIKCVRE